MGTDILRIGTRTHIHACADAWILRRGHTTSVMPFSDIQAQAGRQAGRLTVVAAFAFVAD